MAEPRKRARDEEIVATLVQVILEEGTVSSQTRLAELVNRRLAKRGGLRVTPARVRVLAVRSGLVGITIRTRAGGPTPELSRCPVCGARLKRTANRTLTGATTASGYRCTRCPWWTGRELRIPTHYVFQAKVTRAEGRSDQLAFKPPQQQKLRRDA